MSVHSTETLSGGQGMGPEVSGIALVSQQGFGVRYDLDAETGVVSNPDHDLFGEALSGRILVFSKPKGGVAASWALADLKQRGIAPLAIICKNANPIFAQGALFAGIPLIHGLNSNPCELIQTGDVVNVIPQKGKIELLAW